MIKLTVIVSIVRFPEVTVFEETNSPGAPLWPLVGEVPLWPFCPSPAS